MRAIPRYVYLTTKMANRALNSGAFTALEGQQDWPKAFVEREGKAYFRSRGRKGKLAVIGEGEDVVELHMNAPETAFRESVLTWRGVDVRQNLWALCRQPGWVCSQRLVDIMGCL